MSDDENLRAALALASRGIAVFPCDATKRPRPGVRWKEEATTDAGKLVAWWRRWPQSLPAFEPGRHDLLTIDADRHGGPDGVAAFEAMAANHGDDPRDWPTVETPSTGRHVFFANPDGLTNRRGDLPPGIDVRGKGGYVVAEGATLPDGRSYRAPDGCNGLVDALDAGGAPPLPAWLTDILRGEKLDRAPEQRAIVLPQPVATSPGRERAAFDAALDAETRNVRMAGEGTRNATLNTAAFNLFQMVASGWGSDGEVESALTSAAMDAGLKQPEVRKTIASGRTGGMAKPRPALVERQALPAIEVRLERAPTGELIDSETGEIVEDAERETPAIDEALTHVPGVLGDVVEFIVASSRRPNRRLALAAALPLLGTILGRRMASPTGAATHLYVIATAPTGSGKQHQLDAIDRLMRAAGLARHLGPSEFMSMSALVRHVQSSPLSISAQDEFGAVLAKLAHPRASAHEQGISKVLRSIWGANFSTIQTPAYATAASQDLHCPSMSLFGPTTADELYAALQGKDVVNGFLNRFLVIDGGDHRPAERTPSESLRAIPDSLVRKLQSLYQIGTPRGGNLGFVDKNTAPDPEPVAIPWASQEVEDAHLDFSTAMQDRMADDPECAPFMARVAEIALRAATILACGCAMVPTLGLEHLRWGQALALQSAEKLMADADRYMTDALGAAEFERKLISILKTAPGRTMTLREIGRRMSKHQRNSYDLIAVLKNLKETDTIVEESRSRPGGTSRSIRLI